MRCAAALGRSALLGFVGESVQAADFIKVEVRRPLLLRLQPNVLKKTSRRIQHFTFAEAEPNIYCPATPAALKTAMGARAGDTSAQGFPR